MRAFRTNRNNREPTIQTKALPTAGITRGEAFMNTAVTVADSAVTKVSVMTGLGYVSAAALIIIGIMVMTKAANKVLRWVVGVVLFALAACIVRQLLF